MKKKRVLLYDFCMSSTFEACSSTCKTNHDIVVHCKGWLEKGLKRRREEDHAGGQTPFKIRRWKNNQSGQSPFKLGALGLWRGGNEAGGGRDTIGRRRKLLGLIGAQGGSWRLPYKSAAKLAKKIFIMKLGGLSNVGGLRGVSQPKQNYFVIKNFEENHPRLKTFYQPI